MFYEGHKEITDINTVLLQYQGKHLQICLQFQDCQRGQDPETK